MWWWRLLRIVQSEALESMHNKNNEWAAEGSVKEADIGGVARTQWAVHRPGSERAGQRILRKVSGIVSVSIARCWHMDMQLVFVKVLLMFNNSLTSATYPQYWFDSKAACGLLTSASQLLSYHHLTYPAMPIKDFLLLEATVARPGESNSDGETGEPTSM